MGFCVKKEHPSVLFFFVVPSVKCPNVLHVFVCFLFSVASLFHSFYLCLSLPLSLSVSLSISLSLSLCLSFCFSLSLSLSLLSAPSSFSFSLCLSDNTCLSIFTIFHSNLVSLPCPYPHYMSISCQFKLFIYQFSKKEMFFHFRIGRNLCKQYDHSIKELMFGKWIFIKFTELMFA